MRFKKTLQRLNKNKRMLQKMLKKSPQKKMNKRIKLLKRLKK